MGCGASTKNRGAVAPDGVAPLDIDMNSRGRGKGKGKSDIKTSSVLPELPSNQTAGKGMKHYEAITSTTGATVDDSGLISFEKISNENLFSACKKGKLDAVTKLIHTDLDINMKGMWDSTPLIVACQYGHQPVALALLNVHGIDTNHVNKNGATALLYASLEGMLQVVQKLVSLGVNINPKPTKIYNSYNDKTDLYTPLTVSIVNGHFEILELLVQNGCSVNGRFDSLVVTDNKEKGRVSGLTPIMFACRYARLSIVIFLLTKKAECGYVDSDKCTILHHLCSSTTNSEQTDSIFSCLLEYDVLNPELVCLTNTYDENALHVACEKKNSHLVARLLDVPNCQTELMNAKNLNGMTPLHCAVKRRADKIVKHLLENGADPFIKNRLCSVSSLIGKAPIESLNTISLIRLYRIVSLPSTFFRTMSNETGDSSTGALLGNDNNKKRLFTICKMNQLKQVLKDGWEYFQDGNILFSASPRLVSSLYCTDKEYLFSLSDANGTNFISEINDYLYSNGQDDETELQNSVVSIDQLPQVGEAQSSSVFILLCCEVNIQACGVTKFLDGHKPQKIRFPTKHLRTDKEIFSELKKLRQPTVIQVDYNSHATIDQFSWDDAIIVIPTAISGGPSGYSKLEFVGLVASPLIEGGMKYLEQKIESLSIPFCKETDIDLHQIMNSFNQEMNIDIKTYMEQTIEQLNKEQADTLRSADNQITAREIELQNIKNEIANERKTQDGLIKEMRIYAGVGSEKSGSAGATATNNNSKAPIYRGKQTSY